MSQKGKRFVIQEHTRGKNLHWDFMFELGDTLQTYRLEKAPNNVLYNAINATRIFNHPLKFLTYEGPVNKGKGSIRIAEAGTYQIIHREADRIEFKLNGKILKGKFILRRIKDEIWQFTANS